MRHQKQGKKFGRKVGQRNAFIKGLVSNFLTKEKIRTTETRAKVVKKEAEKIITLAKKQNIASLRLLMARLPKKTAEKTYYEIAPRYAERKGGYIRITKLATRRVGDKAPMSQIELI